MKQPATDAEDLFRVAVELSPSGLLIVDDRGQVVLANREVERMFGYDSGELVGTQVERLVPERFRSRHPDFRVSFMADARTRAMGAGRDLYGLRKDGSEVPIEIGLSPVTTARGMFVLSSIVDISARRRAEDRFRAAVESSPSGMVMVDPNGVIVLVNREIERLFGYEREELIGRSIDVLVPERLRQGHPGYRAAFFGAPRARAMGAGRELFGVRKDGAEVPVEIGLNPIETEEGLFVLSSIVDVSARRKAHAALLESEERFRLIVESIQDYSIIMLDPHGAVVSWNDGAARIKGYAAEEVIGRHFSLFFPKEPGTLELCQQLLETATRSGRCERETFELRKDGSRFLANVLLQALRDESQELRGFVNITRDVTERQHLEEQLRQSQKMEAIGTLAGGIAHDFNNILGAIVGFTEAANEQAGPNQHLVSDLNEVLRAAERARALVRRILTFSRRQEPPKTAARIDQAVSEACHLLRATLPSTIELRRTVDPSSPAVSIDPTQAHQIVMNLVTNSAHAMNSGGVVQVELAPFYARDSFVLSHPDLHEGSYVRLTVTDTGGGMSSAVRQRAFEPFFTTRPPGAGTGLGLAVVHGIVGGAGGAIEIASEIGRGTTVSVYLPSAPLDEQPTASTAAKPLSTSNLRVLFVDDEPSLAKIGTRTLARLGNDVTTHTSSLAALAELRSRPGDFDVVVTDYTMPHLTGLELAREIQRVRPDLPVILVSGHTDALPLDTGVQFFQVLMKPVTTPMYEAALAPLVAARKSRN
jgi:PAS domain S-box-containing protein